LTRRNIVLKFSRRNKICEKGQGIRYIIQNQNSALLMLTFERGMLIKPVGIKSHAWTASQHASGETP